MLHRVDSFMDILGFCFLHSKDLKKHECFSLSIQISDASQLILVRSISNTTSSKPLQLYIKTKQNKAKNHYNHAFRNICLT